MLTWKSVIRIALCEERFGRVKTYFGRFCFPHSPSCLMSSLWRVACVHAGPGVVRTLTGKRRPTLREVGRFPPRPDSRLRRATDGRMCQPRAVAAGKRYSRFS